MGNPCHMVHRFASKVHHALWLKPRGCGKPIPLETWEKQYQSGEWDYLNGSDELGHYMLIVGYAVQTSELPDILDVGCGSGRLLELLPPSCFHSYLGVDFSAEAIARANQLKVPGARFVRGDFETWVPPNAMDIIVLNEMLYFSRRPAELVLRLCQHLKPNGKVIISMYEAKGVRFIWKKLDSVLHPVDQMRLVRGGRQAWQIGLFAPRTEGARASR